MAAEAFSTTRRALLGVAASSCAIALCGGGPSPVIASAASRGARQSSRAYEIWNCRLADYRRLHRRWQTEADTGAFAAANEKYNRTYEELSARFGSWLEAVRSPIGAPLCRDAFAPMNAAETAYYDDFTDPLQRAAVRLALTQAPDLPALLAKIRIMHEHELDELDGMTRPILVVLAEDVRRLSASAGAALVA